MHVSLDSLGRPVVAGEGTFRMPMGVGETDNTLSSPASQAEALRESNRLEYATMARLGQAQAAAASAKSKRAAFNARLASDYEDYVAEYVADSNGGEHPLLYAAAMQTMAGTAHEHHTALGGYGLTQDGQPDWALGASGRFGQTDPSLTAMVTQAQQVMQSATASANAITNGVSTAANSPAATPTTGLTAQFQALMQKTVGGVPVPYLAAGAVVALLILKRRG